MANSTQTYLKSEEKSVFALATSAVAAYELEKRRNAHYTLKITIMCNEASANHIDASSVAALNLTQTGYLGPGGDVYAQ